METREANGTVKHTAIEVVTPKPALAKAYEPQNLTEAMAMAKTLAGSSLLGALKTPEAVFLVMATGAELGVSPTAALRGIHVVNGKPYLSSDMLVAVCLRSQLCEYFTCVESTAQLATYETKRKGAGPVRNTFTIEDAKKAGVAEKDVWKNYGKAMLRHRAAAELARMVYPDLALGLYVEGEISEDTSTAFVQRGEVIDAGVVEEARAPAHDDSLIRVTRGYESAASMDEVMALRTEVAKLNLDKESDDRKALIAMDKEAVARIKAAGA